jgi:hypothetical protein
VLEKGAKSQFETSKNPKNKENKNWVKVIERIYRLNIDNRILNNLR